MLLNVMASFLTFLTKFHNLCFCITLKQLGFFIQLFLTIVAEHSTYVNTRLIVFDYSIEQ